MKRIGVTALHFSSKSFFGSASRSAPRLISNRKNGLLHYLPYLSFMILATAALGASASRTYDFLFDVRPSAGLTRNTAIRRGTELCQALTNAPAQMVSAGTVFTFDRKAHLRHDQWEIICRDENVSYILRLDAERNRLLCFHKQTPPIGAEAGREVRPEAGDPPEFDRVAAIKIGRHYLIATGPAAGAPRMVIRSAAKTGDGRLWDIFCTYVSAQGDRRKARIGVICKDGSLDRFNSFEREFFFSENNS